MSMVKTAQRTVWRRDACRSVAVGMGALALAVTLGACEGSGLSESLGLGKNAPDEFSVTRSAPLTLPPDYTLRPPRPGAPSANQTSLREQAEAALLSEAGAQAADDAAPAATQGEAALVAKAGAADVDPRIRYIVDREFSGYASEDEGFVESLMFWRRTELSGDVVDAEAEAERLRKNAELGRPVTAGETPTIKRRQKAPLEGIF